MIAALLVNKSNRQSEPLACMFYQMRLKTAHFDKVLKPTSFQFIVIALSALVNFFAGNSAHFFLIVRKLERLRDMFNWRSAECFGQSGTDRNSVRSTPARPTKPCRTYVPFYLGSHTNVPKLNHKENTPHLSCSKENLLSSLYYYCID